MSDLFRGQALLRDILELKSSSAPPSRTVCLGVNPKRG
jgi:hypothetical protein